MKRIITFLLICLISIPLMGQNIREKDVNHEKFLTENSIKKFKKKTKDRKRSHHYISKRKIGIIKSYNDEKNSLDSLIYNEWDDALNDWEPSRKEQFTYDANEYIDAQIISIWWPTSVWVPIERYEYTFDGNGNLTSVISQSKIMSPTWNNYQKTEYTYDGNGNLILETEFSWDSTSSIWVNSYKYEYTYNSNQNLTLEVGFEWSAGASQWINMYKDEFFYDSEPLIAYEINYYWNYGASTWDLYSKWEYFYIYLGFGSPLEMEISSLWAENIQDWVYENKYEYYYLSGTNLGVDTGYLWNTNTNEWDPFYKDEYQYDTNDNRTLGTYYEWESSPGEWKEYYQDEFIYDLTYDVTDLIVPYFYESDLSYFNIAFHNMVIGYMGYEFEDPNWVNIDKVVFFYKDYNNSLSVHDEKLARSVKIYPNPVDDVLTIYSEMVPIEKVEVFSILGKKVKESTTNFHAIAMDNFATGVYFLRIYSEHGLTTRKLIKK